MPPVASAARPVDDVRNLTADVSKFGGVVIVTLRSDAPAADVTDEVEVRAVLTTTVIDKLCHTLVADLSHVRLGIDAAEEVINWIDSIHRGRKRSFVAMVAAQDPQVWKLIDLTLKSQRRAIYHLSSGIDALIEAGSEDALFQTLAGARPIGFTTPADKETLEKVLSGKGRITASELAVQFGAVKGVDFSVSRAINRLNALVDKALLVKQPARHGRTASEFHLPFLHNGD